MFKHLSKKVIINQAYRGKLEAYNFNRSCKQSGVHISKIIASYEIYKLSFFLIKISPAIVHIRNSVVFFYLMEKM